MVKSSIQHDLMVNSEKCYFYLRFYLSKLTASSGRPKRNYHNKNISLIKTITMLAGIMSFVMWCGD